MPWTVSKSSSCPTSKPWAVINQTNGHVDGCHPTKAKAQAQQRALYANEPSARRAAAVNGRTLSTELQSSADSLEAKYLAGLTAAYERAITEAGRRASIQFALVAAAEWQPPAEGAVLTAAQLAAIGAALNRQVAREWAAIVVDVAEAPLLRIGIAWDVKHPLVSGQLEAAAQRTGARLGEAVQPILRKAIADAYEQGLSVRDATAVIRSEIRDAAPWQAEMLARTDLNSLANGASKNAARLTGMQFKTWIATLDAVTRPSHVDAHGQTVPINDPFDVGGEDLDYPGDPAGSDAETANCRCTLAYGETLDEANALLADGGSEMAHMTRRQRAKKTRLAAQRRVNETAEALVAGAVAVHHTAVVTGTWDGNAALGRCSSAADYRSICAAFEDGADLSQRQAWHLPHHANPNGPANINGVRNGLGRAPQTTSISPADRAGATTHLRAHLNDYNQRQGKNRIDAFDDMSDAEALAAMDEVWGPASVVGDEAALEDLAAALPSGVTTCSLRGRPGYSGGGLCFTHDGTDAGKQKAIKNAQADHERRTRGMAMIAAAQPVAFNGVATIEGKISDDNSIAPRVLLPDSLSWPEMPVPFMAQTHTAEGHDGAEIAGRIDKFTRQRTTGKMRNITFSGELTTPFGVEEIAPMIEDKTLRYVSADLGASEWALVDRNSLAVVEQQDFDIQKATDGAYALGLTSGKIKAVTLVPTQAIEGAMVALTASADQYGVGILDLGDGEAQVVFAFEAAEVTEALTASAAPAEPPRNWFETQEPPGKMPLTVTEDGRVYGHLATWDSCHVSFLPSCVPPPKSDSNYAYFHVCELDTKEGDTVTVGKLMFSPTDGGHADRGLSAAKASEYYDRTGMAAAYLRVSDGAHGIWASGSLNPELNDQQRQEMRRQLRLHPPSGDWRPINGQYELICALAVAVPGFPTPRAVLTITASGETIALDEAIIASSGVFSPDPEALDALEAIGLVDQEARAELAMADLVSRANWREKLAEIVGE